MQCNDGREYQNPYEEERKYGETGPFRGYGYQGYEYRGAYGRSPQRRSMAVVTWLLLAANVLYFLYLEWQGSTVDGYFMIEHGTMVPLLVVEWKEYYRIFTAFFMHFGIRHLFNNMLLLWYLGSRLEKYLGHGKFAATYLLCGLGGNLISLGYYLITNPYTNTAGASGAVFGIVGAMLWVVVRHRGRLADLTTRQLMLMIIFTLYNGFTDSGINNAAHIGGLVLGFLLGMLFYRGGQSIFRRRPSEPDDEWYDLSGDPY